MFFFDFGRRESAKYRTRGRYFCQNFLALRANFREATSSEVHMDFHVTSRRNELHGELPQRQIVYKWPKIAQMAQN